MSTTCRWRRAVLTLVRSPQVHAKIGVDVGGESPSGRAGVHRRRRRPQRSSVPAVPGGSGHVPALARVRAVRFAGDIVAAVVTETRPPAPMPPSSIVVDYEELPVVLNPRDSVKDETVLFPNLGTNVVVKMPAAEPDPNLLDGCEVVVSGTVVSQRLAAIPLEPRSLGSQVERRRQAQRLAVHPDPAPGPRRPGDDARLEPANVRVVGPDVGGGFGAKGLSAEDVLVCWLARHTGRAVRWIETPQREHGGDEPGARPGRRLPDRRHPRRQGEGVPAERRPGRGRLPGHRRVAAQPHGDDGQRGVRDPEDRGRHHGGGHEHHADRPLPRRRAPGGHAGDRARNRHVRRRAGHGPGRGAARATSFRTTPSRSPPHRARPTTAATTAGRSTRRWRRSATTRCARSSGRGARRATRAARHRDGDVRRGDQRPRRGGVRRREHDAGRRARSRAPDRSRTARGTRPRSR